MSSSATPRFPLLNISSSTRRASALFSSADIGSTPFLQPLMGFSYCDNGRKDQSCQGDGFPRMSLLGFSVNRVRLPPQSWCRGKAMASHHFSERCGVGRAASCGLDDGDHLAEVARAEDAGADDREHLRVDSMIVVEAVDDSARD